jgi:hypothetical protein
MGFPFLSVIPMVIFISTDPADNDQKSTLIDDIVEPGLFVP